MRAFLGFVLGAAVISGSLFLILRSQSIAHWAQRKLYNGPPTVAAPSLGLLTEFRGAVYQRLPGSGHDELVRAGHPLPAGIQLLSRAGASFLIQFANGDGLEFGENTQIVIERWNRNSAESPIFVSVLSGDWKLLGTSGGAVLYILQDGQLSTSAHKNLVAHAPLLITPYMEETSAPPMPPAPAAAPLADSLSGAVDNEPPATGLEAAAPETIETPVTLANEYMDQVLAAQKARLARCQANALRVHPQIKGRLLLGFRIARDGKTTEARVLNTSVPDPSFENCVLEVLTGLRFRGFSGPEIVRSFEVRFE
jgi:hypothetical protein